jgi:RNA polymerase sigma-70 factor, ECF subfamily
MTMKSKSTVWQLTLPQAGVAEAAAPELLMDDQAFAAFYQRTARPLWGYLARVSGSSTLADDLVQESYLRFLGASLRSEGEVYYRRYLFRIATNLLKDHWRRRSESALDDVPESALPLTDNRDDERLDSQALLGPALEQMAPRERQLLWLAYAEGYAHREIAEIMGLRPTSIRILLFRARRKIAKRLRPAFTRGDA